jgi:3-dehydroquinate synthase
VEITIALGSRSYPIVLEHHAQGSFPARLREVCGERPYALVTNVTLEKLYAPLLAQWRDELGIEVVHVIPDGEQYKTLATWQGILDALLAARFDRGAVLIAFGGGVVGDITGFAASAFLRGVAFVQVPTTLLAMVDSSVGGKTGVDHPMGKNLIGAFHQPSMVFADTFFLDTLPRREFVAGYAEVFKNAFIGGRAMFDYIGSAHERILSMDPDELRRAIEKSIRVKAAVVEADERETSGQRALLNFGHTFAHALEVTLGYERILHGEAVLWGIACACELGKRIGSVAPAAIPFYDALLAKLPLPALCGTPSSDALYQAMFSDKKASGGSLRFVLPTEPGESEVRGNVPREAVLATLRAVLG